MPRKALLALESGMSRPRACGEDERGAVIARGGAPNEEAPGRLVTLDGTHRVHDDLGAEVGRLRVHGVNEGEAVGMRNARVVVDLAREDHLAANGLALERHGVEKRALGVDGGREACRTPSDDDEVLAHGVSHESPLSCASLT